MFSAEHLLDLLVMGWLSNIPLGIGSLFTIYIFLERVMRFRGLEEGSRSLTTEVVDALTQRDMEKARRVCEASELPLGAMLLEGLRWQNVAVEDLERIFATLRAELAAGLRKGIWIIGTTGSLAPFVGLFGTVIGIIRAFATMAQSGESGFAVVSASLSEALVATAAGLGVAIVALLLFNYLQTRVTAISASYARASERLVQALLYVESQSEGAGGEH